MPFLPLQAGFLWIAHVYTQSYLPDIEKPDE
jgi:hypothetical protein